MPIVEQTQTKGGDARGHEEHNAKESGGGTGSHRICQSHQFLRVSEGELTVCDTDTLSKADRAAIASIERSSNGIKLKFYDKMKALELLGKYMGMFEGKDDGEENRNNLLEAILAATQEEVETDDIPEIQQAADACHDLVEPAGS